MNAARGIGPVACMPVSKVSCEREIHRRTVIASESCLANGVVHSFVVVEDHLWLGLEAQRVGIFVTFRRQPRATEDIVDLIPGLWAIMKA